MKRHIPLITAIFFAMGVMSNVHVSPEEAQNAAMNYFQKVRHDSKGDCIVRKPESVSLLGKAEMWLVPVNDSWILVSSDKRTAAILARFTSEEKPDFKSFSPGGKYLIACYEYDIEYVRDSCPECPIHESWTRRLSKSRTQKRQTTYNPSEVQPLLGGIEWDQFGNHTYYDCDIIYNKYCPNITTTALYLCGHAAVGCVAVAVGQIMRYWKWPYAADVPTTVGGSTKVKKFYNWDLMPNYLSYFSSTEEVDMVAGFLRDCGYDLDMDYGESSGATDDAARSTFVNFGFDDDSLTLRAKWKTSGWTITLHREIANGRPVYYSGRTSIVGGDGHAFVLDGYDAYDLYHANLGWGGYDDGYYFIDTITVGGSCFSKWQAAIWGIQPARNHCTGLTVTSVESPKFCIAQEGAITIDGVVMNNISHGEIYSEESIRLTPGTKIYSGCNVRCSIKPIPCNPPITPLTNNIAAHRHGIFDDTNNVEGYPNKADNPIEISDEIPISEMFVYNINGELLLHGNKSVLANSFLPNGIYIVKSVTEGGQIIPKKILLQR